MKFEQAIVGIGLLSVMGLPMSAEAKDSKSITLKQIGRYSAGVSTTPDEPRTEIADYDPASKQLFSINLNLRQLEVLNLSNPESQTLSPVQTVPLASPIAWLSATASSPSRSKALRKQTLER
ncbi:MAG: hypothetical protein EHM80_02350 [Nitrospiraceae bacterium]|nr:MAG: hypothetical protein EHM80_02350 [Nitrospiraceae bacterium]